MNNFLWMLLSFFIFICIYVYPMPSRTHAQGDSWFNVPILMDPQLLKNLEKYY